MQRVGLAADALDVVADRQASKSTPVTQPPVSATARARVDALAPCALERLRGLLRRERERRLADGRDAPTAPRSPRSTPTSDRLSSAIPRVGGA